MFLGHYRHSVDSKGRVAVPATFRRDLAHGAVIAPGSEGRIVIWPEDAWKDFVQRFRMATPTGADERTYMRFLFSNSRMVELDAQGRILVSEDHRRFATIGERAVFVGMSDCVELVGEARWDAEQSSLTAEVFTALGDRVSQQDASASTFPPV